MPSGCSSNPIAVVGMACRFPGAGDLSAYWRLLLDGVDAVTEVPADRWDADAFYHPDPAAPGKMNTRWGGFVPDLDHFDPQFFGISPREADQVDPRQRLILEVGWEALEDAGVAPGSLAGTLTGVFVATLEGEYGYDFIARRRRLIDAYSGAGVADCVTANRLSYCLDLHGPSLTVDTACSGSLVALHIACQSLRDGESEIALVGGVNTILDPGANIFFTKAGALSPHGRCRAFDHRADGIVRGEGAGLVVLKPLDRALADGDRVYAVVLGSAVNHNGRSNGLMAPSAGQQAELLRAAYRHAGIEAADVQYVEAHGTGTSLGDPIEAEAIVEVLAEQRSAEQPCAVGSVKTNLGHLEAAAGIAGLIKTSLALHHRTLPPTLHFERLNPLVPFDGVPVRVQTEVGPWPDPSRPLRAGVSSFGLGGANAHVVLASARGEWAEEAASSTPGTVGPELLPISARDHDALMELAADYRRLLDGLDDQELAPLCTAAATRREHHRHRLAVVGDRARMRAALAALPEERGEPSRPSRLVWVFSGQGSQWPRMSAGLERRFEEFRRAIDRVDEVFADLGGPSLRAALDDPAGEALGRSDVMQPAIFAVQAALADLWRQLGIAPDAVAGQSLGEVAAAYAAGSLSLEEAARVVWHRARLMQTTAGTGASLYVALPADDALAAVEEVTLAGRIGPRACVLSGAAEAVARVEHRLAEAGVFHRRLNNGGIAFHGPAMEPLAEELAASLDGLKPQAERIPLYTALAGGAVRGEELSAGYWCRNLCEPFRLDELVAALAEVGVDLFLELAPHPVLARALEDNLAFGDRAATVLASLRRGVTDETPLLAAAAGLYVAGLPLPTVQRVSDRWVDLPLYPWQRRRFWYDSGASDDDLEVESEPGGASGHPLLGTRFEVATGDAAPICWQRRFGSDSLHWLEHHRVFGSTVMPGSALLEMALAAAAEMDLGPVALRAVSFRQMLRLERGALYEVQIVVTAASGGHDFRIASRRADANGEDVSGWTVHAEGQLVALAPEPEASDADRDRVPALHLEQLRRRCTRSVEAKEHYGRMAAIGLDYGASFRVVQRIWRQPGEALAQLALPSSLAPETGRYTVHPALLDGALQALSAVSPGEGAEAHLPVGLGGLRLVAERPAAVEELWCRVALVTGPEADGRLTADLELADGSGRRLAVLEGVELQRLDRVERPGEGPESWLYELEWEELSDDAIDTVTEERRGTWIVLADRGELGEAVRTLLADTGHRTLVARWGDRYQPVDGDHPAVLRLGHRPDLERLLDEIHDSGDAPCAGVLHLWSLDAPADDGLDCDHLTGARRLGLDTAIACCKALANRDTASDARLWIVTRGAQPVRAGEAAGLAQVPVWGLAPSVGHQEHAELWGGLVDLPREAGLGEEAAEQAAREARSLLRAVRASLSGEDLLAVRGGNLFAARLVRAASPPPVPRRLHADATYLVTGGLGALARVAARWLVECGARRLLLVGRSPLPLRHRWSGLPAGDRDARRVAAVRELERLGVSVHVATVDITDRRALGDLLESWDREGRPPIRGALHLAGVVQDRPIVAVEDDDLEAVWGPKARGAWLLHELLADRPLDLFVLFSSMASLISRPGQSVYGAANAFLDGLARFRQMRGLPALSIAWGPWGESGIVARLDLGETLTGFGASPLTDAEGLEALRYASRVPGPFAGALRADWVKVFERFFIGPVPALLDRLRAETGAAGTGVTPELADDQELLEALAGESDAGRRVELLLSHLAGLAARVLRTDPASVEPDLPLAELGMDSIVAIELKTWVERQVGVAIPVEDWLGGSSLHQVAERIEAGHASSPARPASAAGTLGEPVTAVAREAGGGRVA